MLFEPFPHYGDLICYFGDQNFEYDVVLSKNELFTEEVGINLHDLIFAEQIHADGIAIITDEMLQKKRETPFIIPQVDALITDQKKVVLCVKYADCIPLLLYDSSKGVIASIHSGRTGTESNITGKTVRSIKEHFGSDPEHLQVAMGPSICAKHYQVPIDMFDEFVSNTQIAQNYPGLDLKKVVLKQLIAQGIRKENIIDYAICTYEDLEYYSYRRNNTLKRQIAFIGMKNG